jgi:hypothetical protein
VTEQPARVRRRIASEEPSTDPSIKRLYWWGGAVAGVVIGAVAAFFAIPPVFDRYFGVADIALGDQYESGDLSLGVTSAGLAADGQRFEVVLDVGENHGWCPADAVFRLELEDRISIGSATVDPARCEHAAPLVGPVTLSFAAGSHGGELLRILHVDDPEVRFWLQPGEPGE